MKYAGLTPFTTGENDANAFVVVVGGGDGAAVEVVVAAATVDVLRRAIMGSLNLSITLDKLIKNPCDDIIDGSNIIIER
jgi:hypothetical protein